MGLARCVLYSKNILGFLGAIKGQPEWFHSARGAAWIRDIPRRIRLLAWNRSKETEDLCIGSSWKT